MGEFMESENRDDMSQGYSHNNSRYNAPNHDYYNQNNFNNEYNGGSGYNFNKLYDYDDVKAKAKKAYSTIGMGIFIILVVSTILQTLFALSPFGKLAPNSDTTFYISFALMYLIGVPVGLIFMNRTKVSKLAKSNLSFLQFVAIFAVCISFMYLGNIIGMFITNLYSSVSGNTVENPINNLIFGRSILLRIIIVSLIGPFVEELIFRKFIIDRLNIYGEKTAIFVSALLFGLFHGNLFQFFYAFFLGLIFGYVYLRYGKLLYTVLLHVIINFMGGVVSVFMLEKVGTDNLVNIASGDISSLTPEAMAGFTVYMFYVLILIVLFIAGLIIFFRNLKKIRFYSKEREIQKRDVFSVAYLNVGMILAILGCLALIVTSTIASSLG
jgi:hypothetical protein